MDVKFEEELDYQFIQRVVNEVTQSCALPFAVPANRVPEYIIQAAQWFWENVDFACEERLYLLKNSDICKEGKLNKILQLPQFVMGIHGCYKVQERMKYGTMGDFSLERMLMSSYSMFGGAGTVAGGFNGMTGMAGYTLNDVVMSMYEVDTFNQYLNPPLSYSFNQYSSKLNIMGDLGYSDVLINCMIRCRIQDLYNNYYFFRFVVSLCKKALNTIYGMFEFKLPGGVTINYNNLADQASNDIDEIKEWAEKNRSCDYIFMPNTL